MQRSSQAKAGAVAALILGLLGGACGPRAAPSMLSAWPAEECLLLPGSPKVAGAITIALTDTVDPAHAPDPRNESERLVFRQLYETLLRLDCRGRVTPGLAESWRPEDNGRRWTFTLRKTARFWDGSPVIAQDVIASWVTYGASERRLRRGLAPLESVTVNGDRGITVELARPYTSVPLMFAQPALAVARPSQDSAWPEGTGPYRVDESSLQAGGPPGARLIVASPSSWPSGRQSTLRFRVAAGADPRDLLDDEVDLLVTDDPSVLHYAATRAAFVSTPMPWDRTYVLLSRARAGRPTATGVPAGRPVVAIPAELRQSLTRDAVRGEARAPEGPFWWQGLGACELNAPPAGAGLLPGNPRIVYRRGDRAGRDLAERLVALATSGARAGGVDPFSELWPELLGVQRPTSAGLEPQAFAAALRAGSEAAYVLALPKRPVAPCEEAQALMDGIEWLRSSVGTVELQSVLVPLVEARDRVIARRGLSGVVLDGENTPLLADAGWGEE